MNNHKIIKTSVYIVYICIVVFACEYFSFCLLNQNHSLSDFKSRYLYFNKLPEQVTMRKMSETKNPKKSILFFGGSYTYGYLLKDDETFPALVEKLTGRTCYNFGILGHNINSALLFLNIDFQYKDILLNSDPEYIVYTYMFDHILRHYDFLLDLYNTKNIFPENHYNIFYRLWTVKLVKDSIVKRRYYSSYAGNKEIFFRVLQEVKAECDKLFPNSKFIVLLYSDANKDISVLLHDKYKEFGNIPLSEAFDLLYSEELKTRIEQMGISVISTEELIGRKMDKKEDRSSNDRTGPQPSAKAWQEIAPAFVEHYNL